MADSEYDPVADLQSIRKPPDYDPVEDLKAARSTSAPQSVPVQDRYNALVSAAAGAGKATGQGALALQQWLGKGMSWVGIPGGEWLAHDAATGAAKLEAENSPYEQQHPYANMGGQVVSMAASPINKIIPGAGAGTGLVGAAVKGGAQGAALNVLTAPVTDENANFLAEKAKQSVVGAGGGAIGGVLGHILSFGANKAIDLYHAGVNKLFGTDTSTAAEGITRDLFNRMGANVAASTAAKVEPTLGSATPSVPPELFDSMKADVQHALDTGQKIDPAAWERKARAALLPVPVPMLNGQITRDPMQFAAEQNLRGINGVGEPITQRLVDQNRALLGNLDAMGARGAPDIVSTGGTVINALKAADDKAKAGVKAAYQAFRDSTGKTLDVPLAGVAQDYAKVMRDFADKVPGGVQNNLNELGLLSGTQRKMFSIDDAENLLKVINDHYGADPATNKALGVLRGSIQNAITEGAGASAVGPEAVALAQNARKTAKARFDLIDATPALDAVVKGAQPDKFLQKYVLQGNTSEIRNMVGILQKENPAALSTLQNSIMGKIKSDVSNGISDDNAKFSQAQLKKYVTDPNASSRLTEVLGKDKMNILRQLNATAEDALYAPAASAVNTSNTASAGANLVKKTVQGGGLNALLTVGKMVPGLSSASTAAQGALQAKRAADLVDQAVNPSVALKPAQSLNMFLNPGARAGAATASTLVRRKSQE